MSRFIEDEIHGTHAFVQYKNTDICLDFYCRCEAQLHYDGYFAYVLQCPYCETKWEMPCYIIPRVSRREDDVLVVMEKDDEL